MGVCKQSLNELPATGSRLFGARPGFFFFAARNVLHPRMVSATAEARDRVVKEYGAVEGGKQTLERLAKDLAQQSSQCHNFGGGRNRRWRLLYCSRLLTCQSAYNEVTTWTSARLRI
jgi:hypothetical protein